MNEAVTLSDGSAVMIRQLEPADTAEVQAVFEQMGEDARYRRFLEHKPRLSARELKQLTDVDHHRHEALLALEPASGTAIGVARMVRLTGRPDAAEASVSVIDAWQGRGLGGALLEGLVRRAREEGLHRFTAVLLTRNRAMLHLFERIGAVRITSPGGELLELEVELPFATDGPREALRAAAAGEVHGY